MSLSRARTLMMALAVAATLALPAFASAATIRILTGVNGSDTPLASDALDPRWTISVQGGPFVAAKAAAPGHAIICCGMESAGLQADWISDQSISVGSSSTSWGIGPVAVARRSFDLTGWDLSTVSFAGLWRVADFRQGIYLNGNLIDPNTANGGAAWSSDQAFSLAVGSGFFVAGVNVLELRGTSGNSAWDGFWLDGTIEGRVTGGPAVPEPATLTLVGLGLAAAVRRKLRA